MRHVAIDLETMGVSPESAIVSIGAVEFDVGDGIESTVTLGREFYVRVDLQSCIDAGLKIDASTVYWWLSNERDQSARDALIGDENAAREDIKTALILLNTFWSECAAEYIWARGQDFDIGILRTAYSKLRMNHPWKYNKARDSRTLIEAVGFDPSSIPANEDAHNALADAKWEAQAVGRAMLAQVHLHYEAAAHEARVVKHLVGEQGRVVEPISGDFEQRVGGLDNFIHALDKIPADQHADVTLLPIPEGKSPLECRCGREDELNRAEHAGGCPVNFIEPNSITG